MNKLREASYITNLKDKLAYLLGKKGSYLIEKKNIKGDPIVFAEGNKYFIKQCEIETSLAFPGSEVNFELTIL